MREELIQRCIRAMMMLHRCWEIDDYESEEYNNYVIAFREVHSSLTAIEYIELERRIKTIIEGTMRRLNTSED